MSSLINKEIYYVSNLGENTVTIIDGENFRFIDEFKVGSRPYEIETYNNKLYISIDRDNTILIVDHIEKTKKVINIPNNGHIKVNSIFSRVYISNTEELFIYEIDTLELIDRIKGFLAIDCISLSRDGKKIFILDIIQNKILVYDSLSLKLLKEYSDIGNYVNYISASEDNNYIYISDKITKNRKLSSRIIKLNLYSNKITYIELTPGSLITELQENNNFLYLVNKGLGRIDIVDINKNKLIKSIETTFNKPQKIKISKDKNKLLVTSLEFKGRGALDLIDLEKNNLENTFIFDEINTMPYNIGIVNEDIYINEEVMATDIASTKVESKNEVYILAKKIISSYEEKIIFQQEKIEINTKLEIKVEKINFGKCIVNDESKLINFIENKKNYIKLNFEFIIPYYISCIGLDNEKVMFKGNLHGKQEAILYVTDKSELSELEFNVRSSNSLISTPYIKDNFIVFDTIATIGTYVTKEEILCLPFNNIN